MKLLSIGTDKKIFEKGSAVALRQAEYAKNLEEMHIVVFTPKGFKETNIAPNVWVYPTCSRSKFLYPFDAIKLGRFIVKGRGITHIATEDSSLTAMAGISLKKEFKLPIEIHVHTDIGSPNFGYSLPNKIRRAMSLSYLPQADKIRVVSERIKKFLTESLGIDKSKIEVRPISVDIEDIRNAKITIDLHQKYRRFKRIVLMASRLEKEKNIDLAIRAWPDVLKKEPDTGLVIVGSGSEKPKLEKLVNNLGLAEKVVFEPWADRQTLLSFMKSADLFLLTSLFEGYGLSLVEATAAGLPIVSTDVGIAREIGAKISPYDPKALAAAIVIS